MHRRSPQKFARDHAECRALAEPQERAARQALATQQTGAALQVAGAMASFIPVGNFRQAVNVANASSIATEVGAGAAAAGAQGQAEATADYALVVDNCLSRRGYRLLRED